ncbi:MAG: RodZ domain-containing protein, partial [Burkholderiaceae bacterium]
MTEQSLISDERDIHAQTAAGSTQAKDVPEAAGYGARLAAQRERAGLSVTDIAATLRLHPNQVRAIEQEDLTRLPALAYVRGFIRSYARVLSLDPEPLLSDLNAKLAPVRESVVDGMAADFAAARAAGRERMFPQWAIGIALVILVALGVIGWQTTSQPVPASPPQVVVIPTAASSTPAPVPAPVPETAAAAGETDSSSTAVNEPVPTPADVAEPTVRSSVAASGASPTVLLRFNGNSWAEVTDRNGKILLSQLNSAGAEHALDGELPLIVVIGDANFAS